MSIMSLRANRLREREQRSRQTEMTEEEMMDMALRLSEDEARVSMNRMQQEEEGAMSRSLRHTGDVSKGQTQRRGARSPLLDTEPSYCLRSCDSSQMEDAVARRSPVFPSSGCRAAEVRLGQLDQGLLQTCRTSGFVRWSQDTRISLQKPVCPGPLCSGGRSPVFGTAAQQDETSQHRHMLLEPPDLGTHPCSSRIKPDDSPPARDAALKSNREFSEVGNGPIGGPGGWLDNGADGELDDELVGRLNGTMNYGLGGRLDKGLDGELHDRQLDGPENNMVGRPDNGLGISDTILVVSDEDMTPCCPRSPVFPQEHRPCTSSRVEEHGGRRGQNIHYYWGIPFCPGGMDPDVYSKVILAQFEVQEKCLKRAQRRLLNKAPWGGPILPQLEKCLSPEQHVWSPQAPASRRCCVSRRLQVRRQWSAEEEENRAPKHQEEVEDRGETQVETDWEVCPETQLSDSQSVHELKVFTQDGDEPPATSPDLHVLREDSASLEEEQQQEQQEQQQDKTEAANELKEQWGHSDVEDVHSPTVDCPLCQRPFPTNHIEVHAADCFGEADPDPHLQVRLKTCRWRARDISTQETTDNDGVQQEKCYICQRDVCLSEYSRHTERCIQRQRSRSAVRGDFLQALQQNESRDADTSPSHLKLQPGEVIDLRDDDQNTEHTSRIGSSPIRIFTPISEATDCLVNFRRQRTRKPHNRRR